MSKLLQSRICIRYTLSRFGWKSLVSVDLQGFSSVREAEDSKPDKKKGKKSSNNQSESDLLSEKVNTFFKTAERVRRRKENFTPEEEAEHERIAKEYTRQSFILKNRFEKDLALKTWLMNDAVEALPAELKEHAKSFDSTPPPANRPMPRWHTPPIKNFDFQEYVKSLGTDDI